MNRFPYFNQSARICVVGVGGGGVNAISHMIQDGVHGVDFIAVNTGSFPFLLSEASTHIQIGEPGQGTGGDARKGRLAASRSIVALRRALTGADMVFVTAGMGGGTGTGAAPVVAKLAREMGALTVGVVTHPFTFEGGRRVHTARRGIDELTKVADTVIAIPNDNLLTSGNSQTTLTDAFHKSDTILKQAIEGITEIITSPGLINLDFADVQTIMKDSGRAIMAIGTGSGEGGVIDATRMALDAALLGVSADGASGVLFNLRASSELGALEMQQAGDLMRSRVAADVNIIFGLVVDPAMEDDVRITLIATGIDCTHEQLLMPPPLPRRHNQQATPQRDLVATPEAPMRSMATTRTREVRSQFVSSEQMRTRRVLKNIKPIRVKRHQDERFSTSKWSLPAYLRAQDY